MQCLYAPLPWNRLGLVLWKQDNLETASFLQNLPFPKYWSQPVPREWGNSNQQQDHLVSRWLQCEEMEQGLGGKECLLSTGGCNYRLQEQYPPSQGPVVTVSLPHLHPIPTSSLPGRADVSCTYTCRILEVHPQQKGWLLPRATCRLMAGDEGDPPPSSPPVLSPQGPLVSSRAGENSVGA